MKLLTPESIQAAAEAKGRDRARMREMIEEARTRVVPPECNAPLLKLLETPPETPVIDWKAIERDEAEYREWLEEYHEEYELFDHEISDRDFHAFHNRRRVRQ